MSTRRRPPALTESYWPADRSTPLVDHTVGGLLTARAAEHPDREALVGVRHGRTGTARLSYRELLAEAAQVATALSRLAAPGEFVALWAPNVVEWTIIQYGAALAGVVLVALNPVLRDEELDYALRHCRAGVLLHADVGRDHPMADVVRRVCAAIPGLRPVSLSDTAAWRSAAVDPRVLAGAPTDPDTAVMLQYTSGTTGRAKGVLLTHRAVVNVAKLSVECVGVPAGAVCFNPLPLFHTAGCGVATLGTAWVGGTMVLGERFEPASALATLRAEDVSVLFYVPAVLTALLGAQRAADAPAPRLRVIMGGASDVSAELIDGAASVFGADVFNLFGQTELAPTLTLTRPGDSRDDRLCTVGRPLPQVDCKIVDPADGRVLAPGQPGEICARGYQQFLEYLHDPDATAQTVDADGFVHTGDLGRMDTRGFLTVTGRLKEIIIRGGENIAPAAVERVIAGHHDVLEVAAVGLPDERLGEIVAAVCRLSTGQLDGLKDSLLEYCRDHLAPYQVPARWFVAEQLPVTPTGKVRRVALREAVLRAELPEL